MARFIKRCWFVFGPILRDQAGRNLLIWNRLRNRIFFDGNWTFSAVYHSEWFNPEVNKLNWIHQTTLTIPHLFTQPNSSSFKRSRNNILVNFFSFCMTRWMIWKRAKTHQRACFLSWVVASRKKSFWRPIDHATRMVRLTSRPTAEFVVLNRKLVCRHSVNRSIIRRSLTKFGSKPPTRSLA